MINLITIFIIDTIRIISRGLIKDLIKEYLATLLYNSYIEFFGDITAIILP